MGNPPSNGLDLFANDPRITQQYDVHIGDEAMAHLRYEGARMGWVLRAAGSNEFVRISGGYPCAGFATADEALAAYLGSPQPPADTA